MNISFYRQKHQRLEINTFFFLLVNLSFFLNTLFSFNIINYLIGLETSFLYVKCLFKGSNVLSDEIYITSL